MSSAGRPRLLWSISHPTLVRAELPILRRVGFDVVAEEPEPSVLRELDVVNYPDTRSDDGDHDSELAARLRLWARNGEISRAEAAVVNASFDAIMVATRLDVAVNVRRWFDGTVFFRYFGNVPAVPDAARVPDDHTLLAGITGVPIFNTLLDSDLCRALETNHVLRTVVPRPPVPEGIEVGGGENVCLYLGGYPNVLSLRSWVGSIARALPGRTVMVMGLSESDRTAFRGLAGNVDVLPRLATDEYWRRFASSSVVVYPHSDRHHSHYIPLEAMALQIPSLVVANGMVAAEAASTGVAVGTGSGVFPDLDELARALPVLIASDADRRAMAAAQRELLAPFTKPAVLEQARELLSMVGPRHGNETHLGHATSPAGVPTAVALRAAWAHGLQKALTVAPASVAASDVLTRGWSARLRPDRTGALSHLLLQPGPDLVLKLGGPVGDSPEAVAVEVGLTAAGGGRPCATVEVVSGDDVVSTHSLLLRSSRGGSVDLWSRPLTVHAGQAVRVRVRGALDTPAHTLTAVSLQRASRAPNGVERPDKLWQTARADVATLPRAAALPLRTPPVRTLRARIGAGTRIGLRRYRHWATAHAVVVARPTNGDPQYVESFVILGRMVRLRRSAAVDRDVVAAGTVHGVERLTLEDGSGVSAS